MSADHLRLDTEERIREIVREEMAKSAIDPIPGRSLYEPKPKTDLERAAGVLLEEQAMWQRTTGADREAWACIRTLQRINALKPSPDWRKIAEGLADSLRYRSHVGVEADPYNCSCNRRLEAYDAAVKEADSR